MDQNQFFQEETAAKRIACVPGIDDLPLMAKEAINTLRGNIQLSGANLKLISITSALENEGKSTISFFLARSLAALRKKTLYIDGDIRNSRMLKRYGLEDFKGKGLSEFLCGQIPFVRIINESNDPNFDIVFTGAVAPNPSELVSGSLYRKMLSYVREKYDYIIVDTPPILPVIDGALMSKYCDGTILVVESGVTERNQALKALKQLEYADAHVLGIVLNKIGTKKSGYGYGRYGKYGKYGNYGNYGKYGNYGNYGNYGSEVRKKHRSASNIERE